MTYIGPSALAIFIFCHLDEGEGDFFTVLRYLLLISSDAEVNKVLLENKSI